MCEVSNRERETMKRKLLEILTAFVVIMGCLTTGNEINCCATETTDLRNGQKITDSLEMSDDINYYTYTVDKSGYVTLNFTRGDSTLHQGTGWDIRLYDAAGKMLTEYNGIKTDFISPKLSFKQGTQMHINISSNGDGIVPVNQSYGLQMYSVATTSWETETMRMSSDSWESRICDVSELTASKRYGTLWVSADEDIYKLSVPKTGLVTLMFQPLGKKDTIGWGYDIELYKKKGDKLVSYKQIKSSITKQMYVKEGTYYVVVKADWSDDAPSAYDEYAIWAKVKPGTIPSMKSRKLIYEAGTSVLKWKKIKNADGYEIQISPTKKFKKNKTKVYTTVETSCRLGRAVSKGSYYVRVRAYADTLTGNRIYGKFTKVKKMKKGKGKGIVR